MVREEHFKAAVLALLWSDTHLVAMQGIAQLIAPAPEPEDPVPVDRAHFVFAGVFGQVQLFWKRPLARLVVRDRSIPAQRPIWTLLVVDRAPAIQCLPLSISISRVSGLPCHLDGDADRLSSR